jgi:ATP-dependent helicase/nuclease subunit B
VNQLGKDEFEIVDYKTGGYWPAEWQGVFNGGRRLQHALYGLAAAELLRAKYKAARVSRAVYYFSSHKGRRERVPIETPSRASIANVLNDLRETIRQGVFVHAPKPDGCKFCEFTSACGERAAMRAETKLTDPKLQPFSKLAAHV